MIEDRGIDRGDGDLLAAARIIGFTAMNSFDARPHPGFLPRGEGESFAGFLEYRAARWQERYRIDDERTMDNRLDSVPGLGCLACPQWRYPASFRKSLIPLRQPIYTALQSSRFQAGPRSFKIDSPASDLQFWS